MAKKVSTDKKLIEEFLTRGVENVYPNREALEQVLLSGKRLRIYNGIDPTGPVLHLGHAVVLRKLRQLQDLGHEVIMLIGDFTGMIGDPTDKMAVRVPLTRQQVLKNCQGYKKQADKILNFSGSNPVKLMFNSKWLSKLDLTDLLTITSNFTAQQMLARGMFKTRMAEGKDLFLHEFLYPTMQGYDSVAMDVDMEIGGSDQMFNMLAGRTLMKKMKNKEKFVLTTKLLVDPTGKKMGKSEGNMVTLIDLPEEMFGKIMSWPDTFMTPAFEMLTLVPMAEIKQLEKSLASGANPRDVKMRLAREIIALYHNEQKAKAAEANFIKVFSEHAAPTEMPILHLNKKEAKINAVELFLKAGLVASKSEARRLIDQKGLSVDEEVIKTADDWVLVQTGSVLKKGKRYFMRVELE